MVAINWRDQRAKNHTPLKSLVLKKFCWPVKFFKSVLSFECECLRLPYSDRWVSGFSIGLVSKILPISSQAGGKMLLINVGIEVSRGVRRQKFSEMANCSNVDVTMMSWWRHNHTCPHENEREWECVIFVLYYTLKLRISRKNNIWHFIVPASGVTMQDFAEKGGG